MKTGQRANVLQLPEIGVCLIGLELLADLVQLGHPTGCQVTVLQNDPGAALGTLGDQRGGLGTLALAQAYSHQPGGHIPLA